MEAGRLSTGAPYRHPADELQVTQPGATRTAKTARPPSLAEKVCEVLRREILTCTLRPGADLNEAQLAERFAISKTPAREALAQLRQEGLVVTLQRRGYQVAAVTLADMNAIFELRVVLEAGAAERACKRITPDALDHLRRLAAEEPKPGELGLEERFASNRAFHLAVAHAAGNSRLSDHVARQLNALERIFYLGAQFGQQGQDAKVTHSEIVEAIAGNDAAHARLVMTRHNIETQQGLARSLAAGRAFQTLIL